MKIVVQGRITPARLAQVFKIVAAEHDCEDFAGFYQATIQIRSFDKDGLEYTDIYQYEPDKQRKFGVPRGEPLLPAVSTKGLQWAREKFGTEEEHLARNIAANIARMRAVREAAELEAQKQHSDTA